MKARALLAALALLLWAAAWLLPAQAGAGREWWLLDASASMAGAPAPAAVMDPERTRWFARGLARIPEAEAGREESALGAALRTLRAEMRAGDTLRVYTDGRATDALPPRALFADCQISTQAPPPGPRLAELTAPPAWPASGRLALDARVLDADFARAEISVESAPGAVELLSALPAAGGRVRLEVQARDPLRPPALLRLRWREGARSTARAVAVAAPESEPARVLDPALWSESESDFVRAGGTLLLASARLSAWLAVPPEFRPFQPAIERPPLTVLLDRSGSMDQGGLDEARSLLQRWAGEFADGPGFGVRAFAERLEAPLDLRQPEARAQLAAMLPYGPTRLAEALEEACAGLPAGAPLILISDGRAEAPPEGWKRWREAVIGGRRLLCVPVGADSDRPVLELLGEALTEGEFGLRLAQAFDALQEPVRAAALARPGATLPLPAQLELPAPRAALAAAAGAELLMQDGAGRAALALRRSGAGSVLGLAAPAEAGWPDALAPAAAASRRIPGGWWEGRLQIAAGPPPPVAAQNGRTLDLLLLDPGPPALWEAAGADARGAVSVRAAAGGGGWIQPAAPDLEWTAGNEAWTAWVAADLESRNRRGPRPTLMVAALAAASLVFFLSARVRA